MGLTALSLYANDAFLKAHADYRQAKAGDKVAALNLVVDLAVSWLYEHSTRFMPGMLYVAPHAQEASGDGTCTKVCTSDQGAV